MTRNTKVNLLSWLVIIISLGLVYFFAMLMAKEMIPKSLGNILAVLSFFAAKPLSKIVGEYV